MHPQLNPPPVLLGKNRCPLNVAENEKNSDSVLDHDSASTQSPDESDDVSDSEDDHDMTTPSNLPAHSTGKKKSRGKYSRMRLDLKIQRRKKVSESNSGNSKKRKQVHTTGNRSFAEVEEVLFDPETGLLPRADNIWFLEHSRVNKDEYMEWSDNLLKEIGDKMTSLIDDHL
ncbi:hypothetical protein COLO4_22599 [Corchorus olitorius]|uniref:Uncharacterized protein n=1 Tax=Corchorus olitorius TaxID=93759 RepID=A0A1R3IL61_9ROSI|nr:hypothetical protein COLO4_22599 [Corchorus olitorius]